jgi:hypothetical protein
MLRPDPLASIDYSGNFCKIVANLMDKYPPTQLVVNGDYMLPPTPRPISSGAPSVGLKKMRT